MLRHRFAGVVLTAALAATGAAGTAAQGSAEPTEGGVRLDVVGRTEASYHVREQLARLNFPNDAVGVTDAVTGGITLGADGAVLSELSRLQVDLREIASDSRRRDEFIRENTLETDRYPVATFVPGRLDGLPWPLPTAGRATFDLIGDMTVHGVTAEIVWTVEAAFTPAGVTGLARTRFPFRTFDLTIPRVFGLISVDDDIRLELAFELAHADADVD